MTQNTAPVFSDSPRVIESVSEEKMNLYESAHGRELSPQSSVNNATIISSDISYQRTKLIIISTDIQERILS